MRYSPLRQINTGNVERLQPAWTFRTGKPGSEAVPGGHRRSHVRDRSRWRVCAGARDRRVALEVRRVARGPARAGLLAGFGRLAPASVRGQRPIPSGARRHDRKARAGLRQRGPGRSEKGRARRFEGRAVRVAIAARRVRRYRHHRLQQRRGFAQRRRLWRHPRLGRPHRQAPVDIPHRSTTRRSRGRRHGLPMPGRIAPARTPGASSRWM